MKPSILTRYLLRTLTMHWLALFLGLMVIITLSQLPVVLTRAAEHQLARHLIFEVLMLMAVANMPVVMLLTLLLSTVLAIGRLSHDSELIAMRAAGFSPLRLFGVVLLFAAPLIAVLTIVVHDLAPRSFCEAVLARSDASKNLLNAGIKPGSFLPLGEDGTLFVGEVAVDGELRNVFVHTSVDGITGILTARRGRIQPSPSGDYLILQLADGEVHEGVPGERRFRIVRFSELTRPILFPSETYNCNNAEAQPTSSLLASEKRGSVAVLNLRFGLIALAFAFVLIAVPMSMTKPRQSAYARLPLAICAFAASNFVVFGLAKWSGRELQLGSPVFWSLLVAAIAVGIGWLAAAQRGYLFRPRRRR